VRSGEFVFLSGFTGARPGTNEYPAGVGDQVRQAMENLRAALAREGLDFSHVVSSNVFLSDTRSFRAMNEVYRTYFDRGPPTRATVEADLPAPASLVQISLIAARPSVSKEVITPSDLMTPELPYSWGIRVGTTLFIAGLTSRDPETYQPVGGDVGAQTRQAMSNMGAVLRAANLDYDDVASCQVFLDDARDFQEMNAVYRTFFPEDPPARATVRAGLMNPAFKVEIQCVADGSANRTVVPPVTGSSTSPYSTGIRAGDRLFLAGFVGRGPDGYAPGDVEAQTRQSLARVRETLAAGGLDSTDVVHATIYVTDVRQTNAVMQIVDGALPVAVPRTVVGTPLMSPAALVEIMVVAER
jgi:reactive intermediate/imine deaminase